MEIIAALSKSEIAASVLSFLLLLVILKVFLWGKILRLLDERKSKIGLEFQHIEDTKREVMGLRADYEIKLAAIEEAAHKRIEEAVREGKIISEEARKNAQVTAQGIINEARLNIKYELGRAKTELKDEIIELTIKAAESLIREKLTTDGDRKLVGEFLEGIDKI